MVRQESLNSKGMPDSVIPFAITKKEAEERLTAWCDQNKGKEEAKRLRPLISGLKGFYLPYELVRGPVHMQVSRMDGGSTYRCEGFLNDEFVNRSKQLDNLLLDGMEPFDMERMVEFDFSYVAGHQVKISDITDEALKQRAETEAAASYTPAVRKVLQTDAVDIRANAASAVKLPVLLPVYYICEGDLMAAVNGQTGKVSVRAVKESHYYFLPWWLKAILATVVFCGVLFAAFYFFGMNMGTNLISTGMLAIIFIIVNLCLYSDTTKNRFSVEAGREIFTSGGKSFHRERGKLVQDEKLLERRVQKPVFFSSVNGSPQPVELKFASPVRVFKLAALAVIVLFLPVILALFLNGFHFSQLNLGGSAVWFCIFVPVVPIYLLKFGVVELYQNPWIYTITENGRKKRVKTRPKFKVDRHLVGTILRVLFVPPVSLGVWFGILSFCVMVYLTAFGFD